MSTKFSVRPAPRKKPWICKRSPPCLPTPNFPPSLIGTFTLHFRPAGLPDKLWYGSLTLLWQPGPSHYYGRWHSGLDYYECFFFFDPLTSLAFARGIWLLGGVPDSADYLAKTMTLAAPLHYEVATLQTWDPVLHVYLLLTG